MWSQVTACTFLSAALLLWVSWQPVVKGELILSSHVLGRNVSALHNLTALHARLAAVEAGFYHYSTILDQVNDTAALIAPAWKTLNTLENRTTTLWDNYTVLNDRLQGSVELLEHARNKTDDIRSEVARFPGGVPHMILEHHVADYGNGGTASRAAKPAGNWEAVALNNITRDSLHAVTLNPGMDGTFYLPQGIYYAQGFANQCIYRGKVASRLYNHDSGELLLTGSAEMSSVWCCTTLMNCFYTEIAGVFNLTGPGDTALQLQTIGSGTSSMNDYGHGIGGLFTDLTAVHAQLKIWSIPHDIDPTVYL